jgi:hypothetical protein
MSVVEDSRKVLQDFVAPELRAISVRLDVLEKRFEERFQLSEKRFDERFQHLEKRFDEKLEASEKRLGQRIDFLDKRLDGLEQKIDHVDRRAEKRHDEVMSSIKQLINFSLLEQRLARLESKEAAHQ